MKKYILVQKLSNEKYKEIGKSTSLKRIKGAKARFENIHKGKKFEIWTVSS